jgi:hydrogenase/urease accessory protein HupE
VCFQSINIRSAAILWVALSLLGGSVAAQAHQINLSNARVVVGPDRTVDVEIAMKGSDVDRVAGTSVYDADAGRVRPQALAASAAPVLAYIRAHTAVLGGDGTMCGAGAGTVAPDGDGVVVRILWSCAGVADPLRYRSTVLVDVSPDAKQVVLIGAGANPAQDLLDVSRTETALTGEAPPTLLQVVIRFIGAGIEHIFLGYDHIAFLISVVLWSRRLWPVVKIVTAFTLAHSITLSLAALDIVRIPSTIVEPAIAASIVYVAAENFLSRDVEKKWRITFCFGLIHGFGFASALQEFGLPRTALVPALASFNIGVEIGQIAIVSLVMPVLLALDRLPAPGHRGGAVPVRSRLVVYPISALIIGLASYWFLDRTVLSA